MNKELIGTNMIAKFFGVHRETVARMARAGKLPGSYKLNGKNSPLRLNRNDAIALRQAIKALGVGK